MQKIKHLVKKLFPRDRPIKKHYSIMSAIVFVVVVGVIGVWLLNRSSAASSPLFGVSVTDPASSNGVAVYNQDTSEFGHLPIIRIDYTGLPPHDAWTIGIPPISHSDLITSFNAPPTTILSGADDAALSNYFDTAPTGHTIYWSYIHEPEGNIDAGQFTLADYRAAWVHIAALASAAHNPDLRATLILVAYDLAPASHRNWMNYLPPNNVIQVVSWDAYPQDQGQGTGSAPLTPPAQFMGPEVAASKAAGLPFGFSEFAVATGGSSNVTEAQRAAWLTTVGNYLTTSGALYGSYFDSVIPGSLPRDMRLNPGDPAITVWKGFVANSGTGGGGPPPPPPPPSASITTPANKATVNGTVPIDVSVSSNETVSKVVVDVNGSPVDTMTSAPYDYSWNTSSLANGSYTLEAQATSGSGTGSSSDVTVTVDNTTKNTKPPTVPQGLASPSKTDSSITLTWDSATADAKYLVYRGNTVVATTTVPTYTDTGLTPKTSYSYTLVGENAVGVLSAASSPLSVTTSMVPVDTVPPTVPANLKATASGPNQVNLSWSASTDTSGVVTGYKIERDSAALATTATLSYGDATVSPSTTYTYQLAAVNSSGQSSAYTTAVSVTTPKVTTTQAQNGLLTRYYSGTTVGVGTAYQSVSPGIDVDFGTGSPVPGKIPADSYSARWSGRISLSTTGGYTFYAQADGGVALWINNQRVIYSWQMPSNSANSSKIPPRSAYVSLPAGQYNIKVQYFKQGSGNGNVSLSWSGPGIAEQIVPESALFPQRFGLTGDYYANMGLTGTLANTRLDGPIDFNWEGASPISKIPKTGFSVSWTGQVLAPVSGTYAFYTQSDDGARLWVNGQELVNDWHDHSLKENSGTVALTAGKAYNITLDYYQDKGLSSINLLWSTPSISKEPVPVDDLLDTVIPNEVFVPPPTSVPSVNPGGQS